MDGIYFHDGHAASCSCAYCLCAYCLCSYCVNFTACAGIPLAPVCGCYLVNVVIQLDSSILSCQGLPL